MVTVLGRNTEGTWLHIRTNQGLVGWVSAAWVRLLTGSVMSLPIVAAGAIAQPPTTATGVTAKVIAFFLNVRNGPSISHARIGFLQSGNTATVLGRNSAGSWLKIQTIKNLVGWVSARWVILSGTTLTSLPIVS